ncbi:MAG: tRNA uridine-5-carboxymethylaminomethyl(34) synthesis GTPase MnmE [Planctomycetota bacterium]
MTREFCGTTIAALSSAPGVSPRAVVRISGPLSFAALDRLAPASEKRAIEICDICFEGLVLPCLLLRFPAPHSYTGEDVAEIHLPGSPPLVSELMKQLFAFGVSAAKRGEFTRRAFENGKIGLAQAQGVIELINSEDSEARRRSMFSLSGKLSEESANVRDTLLDVLFRIEANLDFSHEDIELISRSESLELLGEARKRLEKLLELGVTHSADIPRVVIIGRPNSGKTTLFNALTESNGLVSPIPSTTTDCLRAVKTLKGVTVEFWDTAGYLQTPREALEFAKGAELVLRLRAADCPEEESLDLGCKTLTVTSKADLAAKAFSGDDFSVSSRTGEGIPELVDGIIAEISRCSSGGLAAWQSESLNKAMKETVEAVAALESGLAEEIAVVHIRSAAESLELFDPSDMSEELLDRIFSTFCIGK